MSDRWWRGPRQIRLIFLAVMILLASSLGILGWWLLQQDRELVAQRLSETKEAAADLVVAALEKQLSAIEQELDRVLSDENAPAANSTNRAIYVRFQGNAVHSWPGNGLVYSPIPRDTVEAPELLFDEADVLEFQKRDYTGALAALREFTSSRDPKVRAAAFVRLARLYRKAGQPQQALKSAEQLAKLGAVEVAGMPAIFAGTLGSVYVFEQQKDRESAAASARTLDQNLLSGQWKLSRAAYVSLSKEVRRVLGDTEKPDLLRPALAEATEWLWERWNADRGGFGSDRQTLVSGSGPVLLLWKSSKETAAAFVAGLDLVSDWLSELKPRLESLHVELVLTDLEGREIRGKAPDAASRPAIRIVPQTGLPWTVQVYSSASATDEFGARRKLLIAGVVALAALILTGTWLIGHAVSRELAVAQLQTDFVSTVSHEFRTPLTTLCQLSELLKRGRVLSDEDRRQYYEFLYTESNRLRRLVEALLNFGRLQAGRLQFRFEEVDAAAFVRQSAAEFIEAQQAHGHRLEIETSQALWIRADRETMRCVLWNLFENAAKYSPSCDTVWVNLSRNGPHIEIEVRDHGVGIPRTEHRRVFEKFVRGVSARQSNVSGTGIGLAMAREIVRAHGGDITLESEPGKGSTFRVVLPELQGEL